MFRKMLIAFAAIALAASAAIAADCVATFNRDYKDPLGGEEFNHSCRRGDTFALYVEWFFNIIKHFRAIATRYEKTARNFLAGLRPRLA